MLLVKIFAAIRETMPATYFISPDEGLITVKVDGNIELEELFGLARGLHEDARYDPDLPLLADLRGMRLELANAASEPFSDFVISRFGSPRNASMAVVVDNDMDRELVAAVYWLSCAVGGNEMFEDYDLALKWLMRREFARAL